MRSIEQLMSLSGRVAIVTGGTGHIGSAMAEALAEADAALVILDLDMGKCIQEATRLHDAYGVETFPLAVDLAREEEVVAVPHKVIEKFGRIDILINCAAFVGTSGLEGWVTDFLSQSAATWRQALEVNLTAAFVLCQKCVPGLEASGNGSIINISSTYGILGPDMRLYEGTKMGNPAAYAASKGGLVQLSRWLATTLAPRIRVNCISPGGIFRNQPEEFCGRYIARTPLQRMGVEEDLKGAALYLASDLSRYVTGQNLVVDGGWSAW